MTNNITCSASKTSLLNGDTVDHRGHKKSCIIHAFILFVLRKCKWYLHGNSIRLWLMLVRVIVARSKSIHSLNRETQFSVIYFLFGWTEPDAEPHHPIDYRYEFTNWIYARKHHLYIEHLSQPTAGILSLQFETLVTLQSHYALQTHYQVRWQSSRIL